MPAISRYATSHDVGPLRGPALETPATGEHAKALTEETNKKGVYVHKVQRDWTDPTRNRSIATHQLKKIADGKIPTPATLVGIGFHKPYNNRSWTDTAGFVFAPNTASVLSYKGDIHTYRLSRAKQFEGNGITDPDFDFSPYASYLSSEFNKLGTTGSLINNRVANNLKLREDITLQREKYRELALRANLCFKNSPDAASEVEDVSSKFLIAKHAMREKPLGEWNKSDLLEWFDRYEHKEKTALDQLFAHAKLKIRDFVSEDQLQNYLQQGAKAPTKKNHYKNMAREWGSLPANEHLLMPSPKNLIGVLVSLDSVFGIDHAGDVLNALDGLSSVPFPSVRTLPCLTHRLSHKLGQAVQVMNLDLEIYPWSSEALIEFAERGVIKTAARVDFKPDHCKLLHAVAHGSGLVSLIKDTEPGETVGKTRAMIDDLSMVRKDGKNLLQILLSSRSDNDSVEAARFFCLWKVPVGSWAIADSAYEIARKLNHPALRVIYEARTWSEQKREQLRQKYITQQLTRILHEDAFEPTYALRNGFSETGKVSYIPELQTYRVTEGRSFPTDSRAPVQDGVRAYVSSRGDMALVAGAISQEPNTQAQLGLWRQDVDSPHADKLNLGVKHLRGDVGADGLRMDTILFHSQVNGLDMQIMLRPVQVVRGKHSIRLKLTVALGEAHGDEFTVAQDRCSSFETTCFVSRNDFDQLLSRIDNKQLFNHLFILRTKFYSGDVPAPERMTKIVKYLLANLRYLKAWQAATGPESRCCDAAKALIEKPNPSIHDQLDTLIKTDQHRLRQTLIESHARMQPLLGKVDQHGTCMYSYLKDVYIASSIADDAPIQVLLGNAYASGAGDLRPDLAISRTLFEKACEHQHAPAQFALGRMHELGQAGLSINTDRALALYQLAAAQGNNEALQARTTLLSALKRAQDAKEAAEREQEEKAIAARVRVERLAAERAQSRCCVVM